MRCVGCQGQLLKWAELLLAAGLCTKSDFQFPPHPASAPLACFGFSCRFETMFAFYTVCVSQHVGGTGLSSPLSEPGADSVLLAGPHTRPLPEMLLTITRHAVDKRMPRQEPVDLGFAWVETVRETARFGMPSIAGASRKSRELRVDGGSILSWFTKTVEIVESRAWPLGIPMRTVVLQVASLPLRNATRISSR